MATRKSSSKPKLAAVTADTTSRQIAFGHGEHSCLSALLGLGSSLPSARYDPAILGHVLDVDAQGKESILEELSNASVAIAQAIQLFGLLMSGQDKTCGWLTHERILDLGFTLHGLGHMSEQIASVAEQIGDAAPASRAIAKEASHG